MGDPDPQVVRQLLAEMRDVDKARRRTAVMKLGMLGGDQALRALINAVQNPYEDLIVRSRAALMLGKIGDPLAVDALVRALTAPGHQTPLNAAQALGKLGDTRAIEPLQVMAATGRDKLRDAAIDALARLGYDINQGETEPEPEPEIP